jgi:hypothetical protein
MAAVRCADGDIKGISKGFNGLRRSRLSFNRPPAFALHFHPAFPPCIYPELSRKLANVTDAQKGLA